MNGSRLAAALFGLGALTALAGWPARSNPADVVSAPAAAASGLAAIRLPPGFRISLYARDLAGARSLTASPSGTLFVGTLDQGKVYALQDTDGDGRADRVRVVASGLRMPNGVAFRDGDLYVAEISRILRYPGIEERLDRPPAPQVVADGYPTETHHGWKFIAFGPDGRLYVPVGAPCNICLPNRDRYALITRLDVATGRREVFARGIRNSVGFDWRPGTDELWFTDNGRDRLGDERPPDELDRAPRPGLDFGYPFCHGGDLPDPQFGGSRGCAGFVPPALALGPHVAALGMRFYTGTRFPARYRGGIFIAEHGSWDRSVPIGYRVTFVRMKDDKPQGYEVFAEGWLRGSTAAGRPVDVQAMPDGALLVSDDKGGRIYRIDYGE